VLRDRADRLLERRRAALNLTSKTVVKHADRAEFHRSRKLIAAARAGGLGVCVHPTARLSPAINEFLLSTGAPGIAVCSRRTEYTTLPERLSFTAAVCLQPLTEEQIDGYLTGGGSRLATLRQAILHDPQLQELSHSPLMLNIMSLAYQGVDSNELAKQKGHSPEERRKQIFGLYVEKMFQRKGTTPLAFPKKKIIGWLSWLAGKMREHSQSVFLVEGLQPSWLGTRTGRVAYRSVIALSLGLFFWLIIELRRAKHPQIRGSNCHGKIRWLYFSLPG
jgi:hypothetical protein